MNMHSVEAHKPRKKLHGEKLGGDRVKSLTFNISCISVGMERTVRAGRQDGWSAHKALG